MLRRLGGRRSSEWPGVTAQTRKPSQAFPKSARIRKRFEYLRLQNQGRKIHTAHFVVFIAASTERPDAAPRIGITVSRRVGGAVVRNRLKRLLREAGRRRRLQFPPGTDMVWVAKRTAATLDFARVDQELETLWQRYCSSR